MPCIFFYLSPLLSDLCNCSFLLFSTICFIIEFLIFQFFPLFFLDLSLLAKNHHVLSICIPFSFFQIFFHIDLVLFILRFINFYLQLHVSGEFSLFFAGTMFWKVLIFLLSGSCIVRVSTLLNVILLKKLIISDFLLVFRLIAYLSRYKMLVLFILFCC